MRQLIKEVYKIVFRLTGHKIFSLSFSLVYITTLNLITICGIIILVKDSLPLHVLAFKYFTLRHLIIPALILLFINFLAVLPLRHLAGISRKHVIIAPLLVYSLVSILLILYLDLLRLI